ncbi:metal-dependent hydrolase family protein [Vibrio mediterranei]|uniref:Amidohydrolase n=1 Tax=Vibrio mediterranei TaxID=689 RepID=A0ABX5D4Z4_9VIBR|nr:amidohydrolase family protein [Vibrio mediterranei]PCD86423.1 amidohydrolase [Vibrio mediterranei]PRQ64750.1 amidohydrolase [Vibrio mediterranei]
MKSIGGKLSLLAASCACALSAQADTILFKNVNVFNGTDNKLYENHYVLVEDNLIKAVSKDVVEVSDAQVIDGSGMTLMPGLIEGHGHLLLNGGNLSDHENNRTIEELAERSTVNARAAFRSGFTTWRDAGGLNTGLRKTIDSGMLEGPRLYTSGAFIGPTGSHADFSNLTTANQHFFGSTTSMARNSVSFNADGITDIKAAARQNFKQGNTQIKIMSSGGVASSFDPWQLNAMSPEEISAAVEIAEAYGSYVMSHAYSKKAILRNLDAGVKTIEHGFMFDGDIAKKMKEKGAYITTNMTAFSPYLTQIEAINSNPASKRKAESATKAFSKYIENVNKYQPKWGFHTDCVGDVTACIKQTDHTIFLAGKELGNFFTLKGLTSVNGEIVKLSGVMDPYPEGKLGVVEEGAYADLILVDGNPLEDLSVIGANEKWFDAEPREADLDTIKVIMKDGVVYKNTL